MAERATVARPYAKAAFAYAREQGTLDQWSGWLGTARLTVLSEEYEAFERSPGVTIEARLGRQSGVAAVAPVIHEQRGEATLGE